MVEVRRHACSGVFCATSNEENRNGRVGWLPPHSHSHRCFLFSFLFIFYIQFAIQSLVFGLTLPSLVLGCRRASSELQKILRVFRIAAFTGFTEIENIWRNLFVCLCLVYSFNLPRVSAQLERLMGTNVVHLTDREYMTELRRRINEDFNEMLNKRIENREVCPISNVWQTQCTDINRTESTRSTRIWCINEHERRLAVKNSRKYSVTKT